jgi:cobalt/nickel transport system permease protein
MRPEPAGLAVSDPAWRWRVPERLARDPRVPLIATLGFVLVVILTPLGAWKLVAAEGLVLAFVLGLAGVEPGLLLRRWLGFVALVAALALLLALNHPLRPVLGLAPLVSALVARNALAILAVLGLSAAVPAHRLIGALGRLGLPAVLVATLHFMGRYRHVLTDERDRMLRARRCRTFRRSGIRDWASLSGLVGHLLVRSMERGDRVHSAMLARGWDGTLRSLDDGSDDNESPSP